MPGKTIAVIECQSLIEALTAVELMLSRSKVTLVGRYFLGERNIATVLRGETEEVESGITALKGEMGDRLRYGIIEGMPKKARDVMLAPFQGFKPVVTVRETDEVGPLPEKKEVPVDSNLEGVVLTESPEGPCASFEDVAGLTSKRKKRLTEILECFWKMRGKKITSKQLGKTLPRIPKATLGRDLDYLSSQDLIIKKGRGRATYYLYKPLISKTAGV